MVKLIVKKAFRNSEDFKMFEEGQEIEVSAERAKDIQERLPEYTEEVKSKPTPKKTTRKPKPKASKNEDDE